MKKRSNFLFAFLVTSSFGSLWSCSSSSQSKGAEVSDADMFAKISEATSFYQGNSSRLAPSGGGHGYVVVRFDSVAAAALTDDGKLPQGEEFPEGSFIVKEAYANASSELNAYVIMYKSPMDPNSGESWVWGEYEQDGEILVSVERQGSPCISCHSITSENSPVAGDTGNRDLVRIFGVYP